MSNIVRCTAILITEVIRIRRKCSRTVCVAHCFAERIVGVEIDLATDVAAERGNQKILVVDASRIVFKITVDTERAGATPGNQRVEGAGQGSIDCARTQHVQGARVAEGNARSQVVRQRVLDANRGLHRVGRANVACQGVN